MLLPKVFKSQVIKRILNLKGIRLQCWNVLSLELRDQIQPSFFMEFFSLSLHFEIHRATVCKRMSLNTALRGACLIRWIVPQVTSFSSCTINEFRATCRWKSISRHMAPWHNDSMVENTTLFISSFKSNGLPATGDFHFHCVSYSQQ